MKAHSKVVIAHEWLPHETVRVNFLTVGIILNPLFFPLQSKVITASWDGLIKLWVRVDCFFTSFIF